MPVVLKALLQQRHLQGHPDFKKAYERVASEIDQDLAGTSPSKAQFYKWTSGELRGLPYAHHCRVLEAMFPGWSTTELFAPIAGEAISHQGGVVTNRPSLAMDFSDFVGPEIESLGVTLVYPTFELTGTALAALSSAGLPRQQYYGKKNTPFQAQHRIDVPIAVAENDVRAIIYVSSMLQRYTNIAFDIETDSRVVEECDRSFISFGLSSNDCTHMYLRGAKRPLFAIKDELESRSDYLEYLELSDGTQFRSTDATNVGIIARIQPGRPQSRSRHWFLCAGLGPRGTAGAAWFFANNWRLLHERAQRADFIAVLTVQSYSDQTAQLEHLLTVPDDAEGAPALP